MIPIRLGLRRILRYTPPPADESSKTEGKKTKFDMAEYDEAFLERIAEIGYEDFMAYLQSLPDLERKAMEEAISRAAGQLAMKYHHEWLTGGAA